LGSPLEPTVAVIEDVHWADEATRDLLVYVARRIAEVNALVVVTYRDDEVGGDHPLRQVLGHVATLSAVERVSLAPLSPAGVASLAAGRGADAGEVHRVTGGNPFFVTEVLAAADGAVPATVADAVLARAGRLSAGARQLVEAASVVPDEVEVELLRAVSGQDVDAIEACVDAGVLTAAGRRSLRFRHELARLSVQASIPELRRVQLHGQVLSWLRDRTGVDPARLAFHADEAGDAEGVLEHAPVAAEQAARLGAHREAVAHYARVLQHAHLLDVEARARLLERLADEQMAIDDEADALNSYDAAVAAWRELGDMGRTSVALSRRMYALWSLGRNDEARASVREAIDALGGRAEGPALATAYTYSAHLHMLAREIPPALDLGQRAVALAEGEDDVALLARALNILGAAQWFVDPDQAERTLARALEVAHRSVDDEIVGIVLRMLGSGAGELRRYATADRWLAEAVSWCVARDLDIHGDYCLAWVARSALEQGRWSEASDTAVEVSERGSQHKPTRIVALTALGRLRTRRGDPGVAEPLEEAWELAEATGICNVCGRWLQAVRRRRGLTEASRRSRAWSAAPSSSRCGSGRRGRSGSWGSGCGGRVSCRRRRRVRRSRSRCRSRGTGGVRRRRGRRSGVRTRWRWRWLTGMIRMRCVGRWASWGSWVRRRWRIAWRPGCVRWGCTICLGVRHGRRSTTREV
jgi:tetratricopeptide (TPR) repeat protein